MRFKHIVLIIALTLIFYVSSCCWAEDSDLYSGPYSFNPLATNSLMEHYSFTSQTWLQRPETRAVLSVVLFLDSTYSSDEKSVINIDDVDYLDASYVFLEDDMISVLYHGTNNLAGKGICLMYTPKDETAAYSLFNLDSGTTFAMLAEALGNSSDQHYENKVSDIIEVISLYKK